jgi:hypothetical protein
MERAITLRGVDLRGSDAAPLADIGSSTTGEG